MDSMKLQAQNYASVIFSAALFSGSSLLLLIINYVVPAPYMDEIFHVDQMQRYCRGRFGEWNDKITTPPAIYIVSYAIWRIADSTAKMAAIFSASAPKFDCESVASLRFLNLLFLLALYFVICNILTIQWTAKSFSSTSASTKSVMLHSTALNLCFFPVLYFTAFLYYTDVLSTLTVLTSYLFYLRRRPAISAVFAAFSCAVRQTNIIWAAFFCYLTAVDKIAESFCSMSKKETTQNRHRADRFIDSEINANLIFNGIKEILQQSKWSEMCALGWKCIIATWPFALVGIGFIGFVLWNGGVALGDRSAHQACLHLVQFCYYSLVTCGFGFVVISSKRNISAVFKSILHNRAIAVLAFGIIFIIIRGFTFDHPYLLADNRHYTFYIWRRWFMRHAVMKYLLIPAYFCAFTAINRSLDGQRGLWKLGYFSAVFLATAPNRLMEFRYFILPFFFWRLHTAPVSKARIGLEFLYFLVINAVTFVLFLCRPFKWENSDEWQRFMW